jgi:hypothetical protein
MRSAVQSVVLVLNGPRALCIARTRGACPLSARQDRLYPTTIAIELERHAQAPFCAAVTVLYGRLTEPDVEAHDPGLSRARREHQQWTGTRQVN